MYLSSRLRKYISDDKNIDIRTVRGTGFILEEVKPERSGSNQDRGVRMTK